jgi:hypothetical protein
VDDREEVALVAGPERYRRSETHENIRVKEFARTVEPDCHPGQSHLAEERLPSAAPSFSPGRRITAARQLRRRTALLVPVYVFEIFTTENTEDHGAPREFFMLEHQALTERIIGCGIEVHHTVGPGLLESVYAECMALELGYTGIRFEAQVTRARHLQRRNYPIGLSRRFRGRKHSRNQSRRCPAPRS